MLIAVHILIQIGLIARVLLRPHRDPTSRIAWIVVIVAIPIVGIIAYVLLGETSIGRQRAAREREVLASLPDISRTSGFDEPTVLPNIPERHLALFNVGQSISGFEPVGGNKAQLMGDSNATIRRMIDDIDRATRHVHLLFYIWMPDNNGRAMAEALKRAVARGVECRAMVDDLGSRRLIKSHLWADMEAAGVKLGRALKIGDPLTRILRGRLDLRNHRKILVIDNAIVYCGSQNCADPEFLTKAKYAPWVDAVMRFTGPVVRQSQFVFATDWMSNGGDDVRDLLLEPMDAPEPGFPAQVIVTGPTGRYSAAPEMFEALMYAARFELFITTPYYVPVESTQSALCAAAHRGVATTIIFPARNDDLAVGATCRSYYAELIEAGVKIYEYGSGLLHTKSLTVDGEVMLIGSANMDRRSFDLNYENNILLCDAAATAELRARQQQYLVDCQPISKEVVEAWGWGTRLWNNAMAIVGPIL